MLSFYDIKKHSLYLSLVKLDDIEKILISIKHILFGKFSIITYHYKSKEKEKKVAENEESAEQKEESPETENKKKE